jgi:hypothetical protein
MALMETHTFMSERKVGYPQDAWDTLFRLERIFYAASALADRDSFTLSVHPWGNDERFVDHTAAIVQNDVFAVSVAV